eukprot:s1112_g7.t1
MAGASLSTSATYLLLKVFALLSRGVTFESPRIELLVNWIPSFKVNLPKGAQSLYKPRLNRRSPAILLIAGAPQGKKRLRINERQISGRMEPVKN